MYVRMFRTKYVPNYFLKEKNKCARYKENCYPNP